MLWDIGLHLRAELFQLFEEVWRRLAVFWHCTPCINKLLKTTVRRCGLRKSRCDFTPDVCRAMLLQEKVKLFPTHRVLSIWYLQQSTNESLYIHLKWRVQYAHVPRPISVFRIERPLQVFCFVVGWNDGNVLGSRVKANMVQFIVNSTVGRYYSECNGPERMSTINKLKINYTECSTY